MSEPYQPFGQSPYSSDNKPSAPFMPPNFGEKFSPSSNPDRGDLPPANYGPGNFTQPPLPYQMGHNPFQQGQFQPNAYPMPYPPAAIPTSGLAVASLVLGIIGLISIFPFGLILGVLPIIFGLIGLVLGVFAKKDLSKNPGTKNGNGMAIAGIVCSAISLVIGIIIAVLWICGEFNSDKYSYSYTPVTNDSSTYGH